MGLINIGGTSGISGDITKPCQTMADIIKDNNPRVRHLLKLFLSDKYLKRLQAIKFQDAQDDVNEQAIRAGKKSFINGKLVDVLIAESGFDPIQFVAMKNQIEDTKRLAMAVQETVEKLRRMPVDVEQTERVSDTFFNRWRKEVETVDDEQLRDVWAAILAQEMTKPKSVSLRTMDVVRNLSLNDAKVFQKMIKGQIEGCIPKGQDGNVQCISFDEVLQMQEGGLLQNSDFAAQTITRTYKKKDGGKGSVLFIESSEYVICTDVGFEISCYPLTNAGLELSRLALIEREEADAIELAQFLDKSTNRKMNVSLHRKTHVSDQTVSWQERPIWVAATSSPTK